MGYFNLHLILISTIEIDSEGRSSYEARATIYAGRTTIPSTPPKIKSALIKIGAVLFID